MSTISFRAHTIRCLLKDGVTAAEIAKRTGVSRASVYEHAKKLGITIERNAYRKRGDGDLARTMIRDG